MRTRYRRRVPRPGRSGYALFGGTGWLFADLLLALALVFLLATTAGAPPPKRSAPHPRVTTTATATPAPRKTGQPEPALDLNPVTVTLTINPSAVMSGNPGAIAAIRTRLASWPGLKSRLAGLVLLYAGDDNGGFPQWQQLDDAVWKILTNGNPVFKVAVRRDFVTHGGSSSQFQFDVYLFKTE